MSEHILFPTSDGKAYTAIPAIGFDPEDSSRHPLESEICFVSMGCEITFGEWDFAYLGIWKSERRDWLLSSGDYLISDVLDGDDAGLFWIPLARMMAKGAAAWGRKKFSL